MYNDNPRRVVEDILAKVWRGGLRNFNVEHYDSAGRPVLDTVSRPGQATSYTPDHNNSSPPLCTLAACLNSSPKKKEKKKNFN